MAKAAKLPPWSGSMAALSRSTAWEGGSASWGKRKGLSVRSALRGDGLHCLPLSLDQHGTDGARTCRATPLVQSDFGDQPAAERGSSKSVRDQVSETQCPDRILIAPSAFRWRSKTPSRADFRLSAASSARQRPNRIAKAE